MSRILHPNGPFQAPISSLTLNLIDLGNFYICLKKVPSCRISLLIESKYIAMVCAEDMGFGHLDNAGRETRTGRKKERRS